MKSRRSIWHKQKCAKWTSDELVALQLLVLVQWRPRLAVTGQVKFAPSGRMCLPRTKHLAELSQAERSEAPLREARPPPKAAGAEGAPELREGFKRKLGCDSTAAFILPQVGGKACSARTGLHILSTMRVPPPVSPRRGGHLQTPEESASHQSAK